MAVRYGKRFLLLNPKMIVGWDSRMSTEKEVVECVGILKN